MKTTKKATLALALIIIIASTVFAQWPIDPATNLLLSNTSGEATIPKIAPTSNGGCYVGWWDNTPGHYCFFLQYLDRNGNIRWAPNGLLISNHAQYTSLTDYSITVDNANCAILAINDIRAGGDLDIYGYRIDTLGTFLWGANGLAISNSTIDDANPRVAATSIGNIIFTWMDYNNVVYVRKVSPTGEDLWSPAIKSLSSTYGDTRPDVVPADVDNVIVQYLIAQSSGLYAPRYLYGRKYDPSGANLWGANGVIISNAGGITAWTQPGICSDGAGGSFSYWYDSRSPNPTIAHVYTQHALASGAMRWTANGVVVSTTAGRQQMEPAFAYHPETGDVMLFYIETNSDQTQQGIYSQKLDSLGTRQWGSGGRSLAALNTQERLLINACAVQNDGIMTYLERPLGDMTNCYVKAMRINGSGNQVWDPSPVTMTTTLSPKGYLYACVNPLDQVIAVWQDNRSDPNGDVYLQNINADGSLGPLPVHEGYIAGLVTEPDGITPLADVNISTYDSLNALVGVDTSSAAGEFNLTIPAGIYHELFSKSGYRDTAITDIAVTGGDTTHVTTSMQLSPGYIAGLVTGPDGNTPLADVIVTTYDSLNATVGTDTSSAAGLFSLTLLGGTYHELFAMAGYFDTTVNNIVVVLAETTHVNVVMQAMPPVPDIFWSPTSFTDTLPQDSLAHDTLYIGNAGSADLIYGLHTDMSWLTATPDSGVIHESSIDTIDVIVDAASLPPGVYNGDIFVNSNDPDQGSISIPLAVYTTSVNPCSYIVGDANGNNTFNGLDVTYSVAYFKGGPPPPYSCLCPSPARWYVAGDVNASCSFNGLDVTYMVAYFKGGPPVHPCPECPPLDR